MKKLLFFILFPIYTAFSFILIWSLEWWISLVDGGVFARLFFIVLIPIFGTMTLFMHLTFEWWTELLPYNYRFVGSYVFMFPGEKPHEPKGGYPFK